jgi:rRNA-processing protein FCF1
MAKQIVRLTIPDALYEELRKIAAEKKTSVRLMAANAFKQIAKQAQGRKVRKS